MTRKRTAKSPQTDSKPASPTGAELYQRMVRRLAAQNATIRRMRKELKASSTIKESDLSEWKRKIEVAEEAINLHQEEMSRLRELLDQTTKQDTDPTWSSP